LEISNDNNILCRWIRYSDYEFKVAEGGELFIAPKEDAKLIITNPMQDQNSLVSML
jgi:hypothetical protein